MFVVVVAPKPWRDSPRSKEVDAKRGTGANHWPSFCQRIQLLQVDIFHFVFCRLLLDVFVFCISGH